MTQDTETSRLGRTIARVLRFICLVVIPPLIIVPLAGLIFTDPPKDDPHKLASAAIETNNLSRTKDAFAALIKTDPLNTRYHYSYVVSHFRLPSTARDDRAVYTEYYQRTRNTDPNIAEIGDFGLGFYFYLKDIPEKALEYLDKIKSPEMPLLNFVKALCFECLGRDEQAETCYRKEIGNSGFVSASVWRLAILLDEQQRYEDLDVIRADSQLLSYFPSALARKLDLRNLKLWPYAKRLFAAVRDDINGVGLAGAILIAIVWLLFLKKLDIFEPEKWRYLLGTFLGGALMVFVALFLYDIFHFYLGFGLTGAPLRDLLYSILGIGFIEEFVKLIPFALVIWLTKEVNESVDYIIYASASALGFAFAENLTYFSQMSLFIIDDRALMCAVGHMFYTSLVGYGIVLAKYRKAGSVLGNIILFFFLACLFHGIYDFWLVSTSVSAYFSLLSLAILLVEVVLYNFIINNSLNQSEFFNLGDLSKLNRMREMLGVALMAVVMFEYVCLAAKYGPDLTLSQFKKVIVFNYFLIFFLSFSLGHYILQRRKWRPLLRRTESEVTGQDN